MIRKAIRKDLDEIMKIVQLAKEKMKALGNDQWGKDYPSRAHYEQDLADEALYVYEFDGKVIGVICISRQGHGEYGEIPWTFNEPYFCLKRMAVSPDHQGLGVGLSFYRFAEELGKEVGIHYICADTSDANKPAIKLFKKADYQFVTERKHDGQPHPFVYYEKKFA